MINAATTGGNLAGQTQKLGLDDVNALATLGAQEQTIKQNEQMFPLTALSKRAELLRGYQIPTNTVNTFEGSPLSAISSLGATAAGIFAKPTTGGKSPFEGMTGYPDVGSWLKSFNSVSPSTVPGHGDTEAPTDPNQVGGSGEGLPTNPSPAPSETNPPDGP